MLLSLIPPLRVALMLGAAFLGIGEEMGLEVGLKWVALLTNVRQD